MLRQLERRGLLRDPNDARNEAENEPMIGCAQLSLRLGKLGRVDEHGRVQPDDMDLDARFARRGKPWCADLDGYSLHAGVTVRGDDDVGGENLCRYVLRHPISLSRLNRSGRRLPTQRAAKTHDHRESKGLRVRAARHRVTRSATISRRDERLARHAAAPCEGVVNSFCNARSASQAGRKGLAV